MKEGYFLLSSYELHKINITAYCMFYNRNKVRLLIQHLYASILVGDCRKKKLFFVFRDVIADAW